MKRCVRIVAICLFFLVFLSSCTSLQTNDSNYDVYNQEQYPDVNLFQLVANKEASDDEIIHAIEAFQSAGIDVDRDYDSNTRETALERAVGDGRIRIVNALLLAGARPDGLAKSSQWTPLFSAVFKGEADIVELLLDYGANPNAKHSMLFGGYETPLNLACDRNVEMPAESRIRIVKTLLAAGAEPNFIRGDGDTPLMSSLSVSRPDDIPSEIPIMLINSGADVNFVNENGWTPFLYAAANDVDENLIWVLIEAGADIYKKMAVQDSVLVMLASNKSLDLVKTFVSLGFDPNDRDIRGFNLLHAICESEKNCTVDGIKYALSLGLDVNSRNSWGSTPLSEAVSHTDDIEVIEYLLNSGAAINATDNDGITPVMMAFAYNPNTQVAQYLIDHGADLIGAGFRRVNLFTYICGTGKYNDNISLLLSMGFDINEQSDSGITPLMYACQSIIPVPGRIKFLLDNGADPTLVDSQFKSALDYARENNRIYNTDEYWLLNDAYYNYDIKKANASTASSVMMQQRAGEPEKRLIEFDSIGISFEIPTDFNAKISTDDEIISNVSEDGVFPVLEAWDPSGTYFITLTTSYVPGETFIHLSEEWVNNQFEMADMDKYYSTMGFDLKELSVFDAGLVDTTKLEFIGSGQYSGRYVTSYQTVINRYNLVFSFSTSSAYYEQAEETVEALLASMDLIGYGELPDCYSPIIQMETNGLTIDCPAGYSWERALLSDSVSIRSNNPEIDSTIITCYVADLYETLSPVEKISTSRSSLDSMSKEDFATNAKIDYSSISDEIIDGMHWYRTTEASEGHIVYFRIYNGYYEMFACGEEPEQEALLIEMIETIRYEN